MLSFQQYLHRYKTSTHHNIDGVVLEGEKKMRKAFLTLLALVLLAGTACGGKETPQPAQPPTEEVSPTEVLYSLNVAADPADGGSISPLEDQYPAGTSVEIKVNPAGGFEFERWSGADSSMSRNLTIVMNGDKQLTAHFIKKPTSTPRPTNTPEPPPCKKPSEVTLDDVGQLIEVCGKVTNFGDAACPECPLGGYSFLKLDNEFLIISYEWLFSADWLEACMLVADTVEQLGNDPVFVFGLGEGYAGSECTYDEQGVMTCDVAEYFMGYWDCD
jgi:hypothetical protein